MSEPDLLPPGYQEDADKMILSDGGDDQLGSREYDDVGEYTVSGGGEDDGGNVHTEQRRVPRDRFTLAGGIALASLGGLLSAIGRLSSSKFEKKSWGKYALALTIVSLVIGVALMILLRFRKNVSNTPLMVASGFLSVWTLLGAILTTFYEPFGVLGNGYISVWATALFSIALFIEVLPSRVQSPVEKRLASISSIGEPEDRHLRMFALCLICSIVVMISGAVKAHEKTAPLHSWAVAAGVISIVFAGIALVPSVPNTTVGRTGIAFFLALWWTAANISLTFESTTLSVANVNGYLGCWGATLASYAILLPHVIHFFQSSNADEYTSFESGP